MSIDLASAEDWYRSARVRLAPGPASDRAPSAHATSVAFAPDLVPYLQHPHVVTRGALAARTLLERARTRYLHGTSVLEVCVVNDVAAELAHGRITTLAPADRVLALQLYCDEGFHAVVASELLARAGVDEAAEPAPPFFAALESVEARTSLAPVLVRFLFVVVTETSISQSLARLARSAAIDEALRGYVSDHARDEARHASFFARVFAAYWRDLSGRERARIAEVLPALTSAFLGPPLAAIDADLAGIGLAAAERAEVLGDVRPTLEALGRRGARPVLGCFARAGVPVAELFGEEV